MAFRKWLLAPVIRGIENMSAALDRITASIATNESATASMLALLSTLSGEIRAGVAGSDDTALLALADKLDAENETISAAVLANTPADPTTPDATDTATPAPVTTSPAVPITVPDDSTDTTAADSTSPPVDNTTGAEPLGAADAPGTGQPPLASAS